MYVAFLVNQNSAQVFLPCHTVSGWLHCPPEADYWPLLDGILPSWGYFKRPAWGQTLWVGPTFQQLVHLSWDHGVQLAPFASGCGSCQGPVLSTSSSLS